MSHEVADHIQKDLIRRGDSVEEFQANINKQDKSVLDWVSTLSIPFTGISERTKLDRD